MNILNNIKFIYQYFWNSLVCFVLLSPCIANSNDGNQKRNRPDSVTLKDAQFICNEAATADDSLRAELAGNNCYDY